MAYGGHAREGRPSSGGSSAHHPRGGSSGSAGAGAGDGGASRSGGSTSPSSPSPSPHGQPKANNGGGNASKKSKGGGGGGGGGRQGDVWHAHILGAAPPGQLRVRVKLRLIREGSTPSPL